MLQTKCMQHLARNVHQKLDMTQCKLAITLIEKLESKCERQCGVDEWRKSEGGWHSIYRHKQAIGSAIALTNAFKSVGTKNCRGYKRFLKRFKTVQFARGPTFEATKSCFVAEAVWFCSFRCWKIYEINVGHSGFKLCFAANTLFNTPYAFSTNSLISSYSIHFIILSFGTLLFLNIILICSQKWITLYLNEY